MAKPTDKITVTMTRSEWHKMLAGAISHDIDIRHKTSIEFERKNKI